MSVHVLHGRCEQLAWGGPSQHRLCFNRVFGVSWGNSGSASTVLPHAPPTLLEGSCRLPLTGSASTGAWHDPRRDGSSRLLGRRVRHGGAHPTPALLQPVVRVSRGRTGSASTGLPHAAANTDVTERGFSFTSIFAAQGGNFDGRDSDLLRRAANTDVSERGFFFTSIFAAQGGNFDDRDSDWPRWAANTAGKAQHTHTFSILRDPPPLL